MRGYIYLFFLLWAMSCYAFESGNLIIDRIVIEKKKSDGKSWDAFKGKPDVVILISMQVAQKRENIYLSGVFKNRYRVLDVINTKIKVAGKEKLYIQIHDRDIAKNDLIGSHTLVFDKEQANKQITISFGQVKTFRYIFTWKDPSEKGEKLPKNEKTEEKTLGKEIPQNLESKIGEKEIKESKLPKETEPKNSKIETKLLEEDPNKTEGKEEGPPVDEKIFEEEPQKPKIEELPEEEEFHPRYRAWKPESKVVPSKVMGTLKCGMCHALEEKIGKKTAHQKGYDSLHKKSRAKAIMKNLGLSGRIHKAEQCISCHYTVQETKGVQETIEGISCESCHGGGKDWIISHSDWEVPLPKRWEEAKDKGMIPSTDIYELGRKCYQCHTISDEKLINQGKHTSGEFFEFARYSQGSIGHNFMQGHVNQTTSQEKLRVIYITGAMLNLEYSLRAYCMAKNDKGKYFKSMDKNTRKALRNIRDITKKVQIPEVEALIDVLKGEKLLLENKKALLLLAEEAGKLAKKFAYNHSGKELEAIDSLLPKKREYK